MFNVMLSTTCSLSSFETSKKNGLGKMLFLAAQKVFEVGTGIGSSNLKKLRSRFRIKHF